MNIYEKLKSNIQVRKFEKYTKRRSFIPEFDSRDKEYYKQAYHNGVYEIPPPQEKITVKLHKAQRRLSRTAYFILTGVTKPKDQDQESPRCSENYNKRKRNSLN